MLVNLMTGDRGRKLNIPKEEAEVSCDKKFGPRIYLFRKNVSKLDQSLLSKIK